MNEKDYMYKVTAAGRVNIIGEHIDYCGGSVMPAALSLKNTVLVRPNGTDKINIKWSTLPDEVSIDINSPENYLGLKYGNYQAACAVELKKEGIKLVGCDIYEDCTVPFGSGLSSSAAIEVSTIGALCAVVGADKNITPEKIALIAQRAEHSLGVNCGIMDQYASACGRKNSVMLLDCNTLNCEYLPLVLGKYSLVIADCKKPHKLTESKYNERRAETEDALEVLGKKLNVTCLAQITPKKFEECADMLAPTIKKRVRHVVNECERVRQSVVALKAGDIVTLGKLLNESHLSLKDDFEVTGRELDALAFAAQSHPSCIGSRMVGGGFGGCTISLVETVGVQDFKAYVSKKYHESTGYNAEFYSADIADGLTITECGK